VTAHRPSRLLPPLLLCLVPACTGFRTVSAGVYRSGQPTEDQLARTIVSHDLRAVVCLRGHGDETASSARAAQGAGIEFWNVPMSATRPPSPETLLALWRVAAEAPRPLLLHCRAGVDRTGLASAIVVLHDTGDLTAARGQLALVPNGHLGMFGTEAMGEVLDAYEPHASRLPFPDWVRTVYTAEFAAARQ
jgi:protein tyrosine/serine phosphatase